jgi:cation diffusion facilitator CzcD-associated flavoprotein CzcO
MKAEYVDVLIVGAGLSGIGAACHLQKDRPKDSFAILEGRAAIGGTWDLFRYPGIRSDSDMYTMGYAFRPWTNPKSIADGASIREYIRDTAREAGLESKIRFKHKVTRAAWSSKDARWTVEAVRSDSTGEQTVRFSCRFLFMCSGYYRYSAGFTPEFAGTERFKGRIVHPQAWPEDLDYANKRVVVIGSGATAVTLVPSMAPRAAHVTMLQRSPTYVVSLPERDRFANRLQRVLPEKAAYGITRWKNVLMGMWFFQLSRRKPKWVKHAILRGVRDQLGPDYDVRKHFSPRYKPWDQRVCLVPDADLFVAIKSGRASVVTDHIETFTEHGLKLKSGQELEADIIVTATGLELESLGGMELQVDGQIVDVATCVNYKGMMYSDVPNLAACFGYTNASWTLKCDLTCDYVCRLLSYMDAHGYAQATPRKHDPFMPTVPGMDFSSTYVQRAKDRIPKQGTRAPWKLYQNYALDIMLLRFGSVADKAMEFSNPAPTKSAEAPRRRTFTRVRDKAATTRAAMPR